MNASNPVMSLAGVTKRFGSVTAVDELSLELEEGEFFALLGPSGCGKTTLLRMLAGFEMPDQGCVRLDGADITALRANQRPVNLMFQSYALFPHMTVRANVRYGLEMEKLERAEIERRVDEVLERTQLEGMARRKPDQLSGGQRQRVALARALIKRPRVLLLDEPLAALDRKLREEMQLELKRLQHDVGITFVVVTHDQGEALVMADRVALMQDGSIEQLGRPRDLYEHPHSRFVAGFIGTTNLLEGTAETEGVRLEGHGLLKCATESQPAAGTAAAIAVRPERITLHVQAEPKSANAVKGEITDIAYHGQDLNVHVAVQGVERHVQVRISTADDAAAAYEIGRSVWCAWEPQHGRMLTR